MISANKSGLTKLDFLDLSHKGKENGKKSKHCVGEGNLINVFEFQMDDMAH